MGSGTSARNIGIWGYQQGQDAILKGQGILDQARGDALSALGQGFGQARTDLNTQYTGAIDRLNPWVTAGQGALGTYQGSLGLGGQAERDAAVAAFQNSPGFQYAVDQASDATARKASALGALGSGNTMQAIADRAQNMQNQEYGNWQNMVKGVSDSGLAAAGTQAGLQGQWGNQLANLGQSQGQSEAGVHTGLAGLGVNNLWQGTNLGVNAVTNASNKASEKVAAQRNLGLGLGGAALSLLTLGMGSPLLAAGLAGASASGLGKTSGSGGLY